MISLTHRATYKDGGSKRYIDKKTKTSYWLSNKFGDRYKNIKGKLFIGDINKEPYVLAKGIFLLDNNKIIKQ